MAEHAHHEIVHHHDDSNAAIFTVLVVILLALFAFGIFTYAMGWEMLGDRNENDSGLRIEGGVEVPGGGGNGTSY